MKELSIEEKAMAYDKAIKIAKEINNEQKAQPFNIMTRVFPELKESKDEIIRKKLITFFQRFPYTNLYDANLNVKDVLAWLEKQGEQKTAVIDFNAKDWYVSKVDGKIHDMTYNPTDIEYHSGEPTFDDGWNAAIWYLKKRNVMPQRRWKPSEELMNNLSRAANGASYHTDLLLQLYIQLKQL